MQTDEIKGKIREVITQVTEIPSEEYGDDTSFTQELDLDSLALLEIGVDVDYAFQLNLPDERFKDIDSVNDAVQLVVTELEAREAGEPAKSAQVA